MHIKKIAKLFEADNVCVTGLRGSGKDVIMGNVIALRKAPYNSNIDYGGYFCRLKISDLCMNGNTYKDFIEDTTKEWHYPYARGSDVYISDAGVYFPAQYCNELNKLYPGIAQYGALSRQLAHANFHVNVQNLNRCFDKIRELSGTYIRTRKCLFPFYRIPILNLFLGKFCIVLWTYYDKYESCVARVKPCRVRVPMFNKNAQIQARIYRDSFFNQHGEVKNHITMMFSKSEHDTFYFERLLRDGGHK